ncbi:MAG: GNAT family N-acetyltransferase [Proteobacteria bacterium]|nr:GNAT family N-acetyltransferase [Pseudomonadota bacterium]
MIDGNAGRAVTTDRLLLRLPRPDEAAALAELADDWEVARHTASLPHPFRESDGVAWIAKSRAAVAEGVLLRVIERRDGGELVGVISCTRRRHHDQLGYWIGRRWWGQGFATAAAGAVCLSAFAAGARRVRAGVFLENAASRRVLEKAGFACLGEAVSHFEHRGGERRIVRYARNAGDPAPTGPVTLVAAAALIDGQGRVLLQRRPPGRPMAGLWEFPGGKVAPGEQAPAGLKRELAEELGIDIAVPPEGEFAHASHAYGDFHLVMPLYLVRDWRGVPEPREGQQLAWVAPGDLDGRDMPAADAPLIAAVIDALRP